VNLQDSKFINNQNIDMRIDKLISNFKNSSIKHLELYFKNYIEIDEMIFYNEPRICRVKIFNANINTNDIIKIIIIMQKINILILLLKL
jgi:hypothetical protein